MPPLLIRYALLPLIGACLAFGIGWHTVHKRDALARLSPSWLWGALAIIGGLATAGATLRLLTYHYGYFDLGLYDQRVWIISRLSWSAQWLMSLSFGHLQPILVPYAWLYRAWSHPLLLQLCQILSLLAAVWGCWIVGKDLLGESSLAVRVALLFLLSPLTLYNLLVSFHPDSLAPFFMFGAFWSLHHRRWGWLALSLILLGCLKELFWLNVAGFGGLLIVTVPSAKRWGWILAAGGLAVFFFGLLVLIPKLNIVMSDSIMPPGRPLSPLASAEDFQNFFHPKKLLLIYLMLVPCLGLPLLSPITWLPLLPTLGIIAVSTSLHHAMIDSHYTLTLLAPLSVAGMLALLEIKKRYGESFMRGILNAVLVMTAASTFFHSPMPWAMQFWNPGWSGKMWHYSRYVHEPHDAQLEEGLRLIPEDRRAKIVAHNLIVHPRVTHHDSYEAFPLAWEQADYIILDHHRGPAIRDGFDEDRYRQYVAAVSSSPAFHLIFNQREVMVFRKTPAP